MWLPRRRFFRLLSLCAFSSLLVLIVRRTIGDGPSLPRNLGDLLGRIRFNFAQVSQPTNSSVVGWQQSLVLINNSTQNVILPRLYASLKRLEGSPTKVNFTPPTSKVCQRPKSQSIAEESLLMLRDGASQNQRTYVWNLANSGAPLWAPSDCWPPLSRTAVIVPYRNRSDNLDIFVPYMQHVLQKQNILFGIFVVEQSNAKLFNRAKLINVGFLMAQQFHDFDCFVFHDSDKLPENAANLYDCATSPKLLISEMRKQGDTTRKYNRGQLYTGFFGGVVAISREAFLKVNGNSNQYYGWGREDDELSARLSLSGYHIHYSTGTDARFVNLHHGSDIVTNTMPWPYANKVRQNMKSDGLNSLNYTDMGIYLHPMFILIRVDV